MADYNDERLSRHRQEINQLWDRGDNHSKKLETLQTDFNSLQAAANRRALDAREATTTQIEALREEVKKGEGIIDSVNVIELQTSARLRTFATESADKQRQITKLEELVHSLTSRLEQLEAVPTRRCTSCDIVIRPVKSSHLKCESCYLVKILKKCTKCGDKFNPTHHSYKVCPFCYLLKKSKQAP